MKEVVIAKYLETGNKIGEFKNVRKASIQLKISSSLIYAVISGKYKSMTYNNCKITFRKLYKDKNGKLKRSAV